MVKSLGPYRDPSLHYWFLLDAFSTVRVNIAVLYNARVLGLLSQGTHQLERKTLFACAPVILIRYPQNN